ncbi:MAG: gamma-glutamyltransferase, partial [Flavobacterium sp.]|nr:gamma-glutamyltransferase [Flavobacterium sp.]
MKKLILFLFVISCGCKSQVAVNKPTGLQASKAMVVSAREEASKIGVAIMKKGGNAFDA